MTLLKTEPGSPNVIGEAAVNGERALHGALRVKPLSVEQYDAMIDSGLLDEDTSIELLDGILTAKDRGDAGGDPMTVGGDHRYVVERVSRLGRRLDESRVHMQTQQPIIIPDDGEPEPDAAIIGRSLWGLGGEKPQARIVSCVIEIAGTSLHRDRTTKLRHYARGGISQYVILNLAERTAEEHRQPDASAGVYTRRIVHQPDQRLTLALGDDQTLDVGLRELFPAQ